jgi:ribosomal protein L40E
MKIFMDYFNLQELPPDIKEEAAKALAAFNDQKAALAEIERYFQDHERSHITKGNEMTVTAAKSLIASYESFGAMASEYSKIECLKCGHRNPPESKLCEKCKTEIVLPKISQANLEMSFSDANDMPPNFANLFQAVENVRSGRSVPEEFGAAIDQFAVLIERQKPAMEKVLREDMKAIQPEVVGEEIYTAFRDLAEQMLASVDQTSSGLQWMKKYIDTRDAGDLTAGWERVLLGGKEMQRVTKAMGDLMTRKGEALQAEASAEQPPPGESVTIRGEDE